MTDYPTIALLITMLNTGYDAPIDPVQAGCLVSAVYHESASEPLQGKAAVAQTVINRMQQSGESACEVIYKPYQFSFTLLDPEELLARESKQDSATRQAVLESAQVALQALSGGLAIHQATHYYNPDKVSPKWAKAFDQSVTIGSHKFVF